MEGNFEFPCLLHAVPCWSAELCCLVQASKAYSFRRGTTQAGINCLAFSAEGVTPRLLACASSHGTVHLWNLDRLGPLTARGSGSLLAAVIPSSMADYVDPQRCIITLRLPTGVPTLVAIQVKHLLN